MAPHVVQKDIRSAGVNTKIFPLHQILGFKISLEVLGFQIVENGPTGALVRAPEGPKRIFFELLKLMIGYSSFGEKIFAAQPVPLDEIADYVKGCQRPFNMYIHRPARENSGPVTISLLDDSEDEIDVPGDNCASSKVGSYWKVSRTWTTYAEISADCGSQQHKHFNVIESKYQPK